MTNPTNALTTNEDAVDAGRLGHDQGGPSGEAQDLSSIEDAAAESVQELADSGQSYEAEVIEGVEDAADHPEQPVRTHESGVPLPFPSNDGD